MKPGIRREAQSPAEAAYNAFCEATGMTMPDGGFVTPWSAAHKEIQAAWESAARAAIVWVRVRDRFAQGALSAMQVEADCDPQDVAYKAYEIGEAMMRERQRRWEQRMQAHQRQEGQ